MYAVRPVKAGYSFVPAIANITAMTNTGGFADIIEVNFVGTRAHVISGKITFNGAPLAGVSIGLHGTVIKTVVTDSKGEYHFLDLPAGHYMLTPSLPGYEFTPEMVEVMLDGTGDIDVDFTSGTIDGGAPPPGNGGGGGVAPILTGGGGSGGCFIDTLRR
jgi:hypothetical protein